MQKFDFKKSVEMGHRPAWVAWLQKNQNRPITVEQFMEAKRALRPTDTRPQKCKRYATFKLKKDYRYLKEEFGFFK